MEFLVTGSNGFIGKHLVEKLEEKGHEVEKFDRSDKEEQHIYHNYELLSEKVEGKDYIFHLAGVTDVWDENHQDLLESNILGVRNIAKASAEHHVPVMFTSSLTAKNPTNLYAETKRIGEDILANSDCSAGWIRLSNVVGEGNRKGQVHAMIKQAVQDKEIEVWGNGEIKRSYVDVDRVCRELFENIGKEGLINELGVITKTNDGIADLIMRFMDDVEQQEIEKKHVDKMPPSPKELTVDQVEAGAIINGIRDMISEEKERN